MMYLNLNQALTVYPLQMVYDFLQSQLCGAYARKGSRTEIKGLAQITVGKAVMRELQFAGTFRIQIRVKNT